MTDFRKGEDGRAVSRTGKRVMEAQKEQRLREAQAGLEEGWQHEFIPRVLPPAWDRLVSAVDGAAFERRDGLTVFVSAALEDDGKRWLHVSVSYANRIPPWGDVKLAKNLFIGRDLAAYIVFPRASEYVNVNPYVLHLFASLDGKPALPDFTQGTGSI